MHFEPESSSLNFVERPSLHIGVVGLGYVGAVTAACLAHLGHFVSGFERDPLKVSRIQSGLSPFYEPDLDGLLAEAIGSGHLVVHPDFENAVDDLDVMLICVGTPSRPDGAHDRSQLERVSEDLGRTLCHRRRRKPLVIAIRGTVTPGTTDDLRARFFGEVPSVAFAYIPEFLREGTAIHDFFEPSLLVVGANDSAVARSALALFDGIEAPKRVLPVRAAELVKGVCNAFHALKAAFANETGALAAATGVDPSELMAVFCDDTRLNISAAYLRPGFAFGGSCLPKDVRALNHLAQTMDLSLPLYDTILVSNEEHLHRAARRVLDAGLKRAGLVGLSFKHQTDDVRESPALQLAAILKSAAVEVRAFDMDIRPHMLHGANLHALEQVLGSASTALLPSVDELAGWADGLVLTKRPSPLLMEKIAALTPCVIDLSRIGS